MFTFLVIVTNNNEVYYGQDGLQLKRNLVWNAIFNKYFDVCYVSIAYSKVEI